MNEEVTDAALNWWRSIRPIGYKLMDHLNNPEVNTTNDAESRLANAVAEYLEAGIRFKEYLEAPTYTEEGKALIRDAVKTAENEARE